MTYWGLLHHGKNILFGVQFKEHALHEEFVEKSEYKVG
jgi:hypothetical protein